MPLNYSRKSGESWANCMTEFAASQNPSDAEEKDYC